MPPRRSASYPLYIERTDAPTRRATDARRLVRLALGAWAGLVYLIYWIGALGIR